MTLPKRAVIIIASVGMLLSAGANLSFAQTDEQLADYSRPGPYLGLFFVWGKEAFDVSDIEDNIASDLEDARRATTPPDCDPNQGIPCTVSINVDRRDTPGGAFRAGYRFNSLFAAELDYQYLHQFEIDRKDNYHFSDAVLANPANAPIIAAADRDVRADITVHSIMANGKLYPMTGVIQPYLLAGLGVLIGDTDEKAQGGGSSVEPIFAGRIGGGIDFYLTRSVAWNFDVSYTITPKDFSPDGLERDISLTHVPISTGLIYRFGEPPAQPAPPPPPPAPVAAPPAAPIKKKLVLRGVNFDFDKANIREDARPVLDEAIATLKEAGEIQVSVEGHTDSVGSDQYNQGLSVRRANSVADYLADGGIARDRMTVKGFGESQPVASNDTDDGRAQNRRVELQVVP
jgi:outer membrane protein OmpA-like peptidoglycan-associated protein/opacity protein-like surface antigen